MCNYCGCREFPLIARLTEEHEAIASCSAALRRCVRRGVADQALLRLAELVGLLLPHASTEESGLFTELRAEGLSEVVDRLCAEHTQIHEVLAAQLASGTPSWPSVFAALDLLHRHIDREEHGIFPAAAVTLSMPAWDRITPVPTSTFIVDRSV
jgi:hemerythrin-like domain-containing protein